MSGYVFTPHPVPNPEWFETYADDGFFVAVPNTTLRYFIAQAEVGVDEDTGNLMIWKSADSGVTWTQIVNSSDYSATNLPAVALVGSIIYIVLFDTDISPSNTWGMYRFQTGSDTFLTDDYAGPTDAGGNSRTPQLVPWMDGSLLFIYGVGKASIWTAPGSWGTPFTLNNAGGDPFPLWALRETTTDRVHAFYFDGSTTLDHVSVDKPNTVNTLQTLVTNAGYFPTQQQYVGMPSMFDAFSQIILPYLDLTDGLLHVQRGMQADNPTWTDEVIDTSALTAAGYQIGCQLPVGFFITGYYFPAAAVQIGSTLYMIFCVNNGGNSTTVQGLLCESHTTAGSNGWSTPTVIMQPPGPTFFLSPFPQAISATKFGLMTANILAPLAVAGSPDPYAVAITTSVTLAGTPDFILPPDNSIIQHAGTGTTLTGTVDTTLSNDLTANLFLNGTQVATITIPHTTGMGDTVTVDISAISFVVGDVVSWTLSGSGSGSATFVANYESPTPSLPPSLKYQSLTMWYFEPGTEPLSLTCPTGTAQVGVPYSSSFTATGGTPPYTFAIIAGALPPGLTLNTSTGLVSGTPTAFSIYSYTGQVTDSLGATQQTTCSIIVSPPPLMLACPSSTSAVGTPYSSALIATGGQPPYTFAIIAGSLPPGLALNTSTGVISGIPTSNGNYPYTAQVTDSAANTATAMCSFSVANCGPTGLTLGQSTPIR